MVISEDNNIRFLVELVNTYRRTIKSPTYLEDVNLNISTDFRAPLQISLMWLKSFSLGVFNPLLLAVIITSSTSAGLITIFIILRKRRLKNSEKEKNAKTKKLLRKIK